jgi:hypothetical protein
MPIKVITVRATAFAAAPRVGPIKVGGPGATKSTRPELGAAKVIVSDGGRWAAARTSTSCWSPWRRLSSRYSISHLLLL